MNTLERLSAIFKSSFKATLPEGRLERRQLVAETKKLVLNYWEDGKFRESYVPYATYVEFAPGCFVKGVDLEHNGMSVLIWEIPEVFHMPWHCHDSYESLAVIRGRIMVEARMADDVIKQTLLSDKKPPLLIPPHRVHKGRTLAKEDRTVVITTYKPALTIKQALNAVGS